MSPGHHVIWTEANRAFEGKPFSFSSIHHPSTPHPHEVHDNPHVGQSADGLNIQYPVLPSWKQPSGNIVPAGQLESFTSAMHVIHTTHVNEQDLHTM